MSLNHLNLSRKLANWRSSEVENTIVTQRKNAPSILFSSQNKKFKQIFFQKNLNSPTNYIYEL